MKPKRLQLTLLAALSCAVLSCSDSAKPETLQQEQPPVVANVLTREAAAEAIIQHYDFPNVDIARIAYGYSRHRVTTNNTYEISENSDVFYKVGDRTFQTGLTNLGLQYVAPKKACEAFFGPVSQPHVESDCFCVAENKWEFKEVAGISTDGAGKSATVEYVVIATGVNTFGSYKDKREGMEETRKATLKKYDDGSWRVEDAKPKYVVKPGDIPFYANKNNNQ